MARAMDLFSTAPAWRILVADNSAELDETIIATGFAGITDLKVGPDGRLYVVSFGDGKIYAISSGGTAPLSVGVAGLPTG